MPKRSVKQITFEDPNGIKCQGHCARTLTPESFYEGNTSRCKRCVNARVSQNKSRKGSAAPQVFTTVRRAKYVDKIINGRTIPVYTIYESQW